MRKSLSIILLSVFLSGCGELTRRENDDLTIVFCGDVLLDRGLRPIIDRHGAEYLFQDVQEYYKTADAVVVNLECPISPSPTPLNKKYIFRADTTAAQSLRKSGITHCCLGNNHSVDQGITGLKSTYRLLRENGIVPIGFGLDSAERRQPAIVSKNGVEAAIFSATPLLIENYVSIDSLPGIWNRGIDDICMTVRNFRQKNPHTRIILSIHWGVEFFDTPSIHQKMEARRLISSGADVIIGHHPHVKQPVELIDGKPVFYSIGNFVFDQSRPQCREGIMPIIRLGKDTIIYDIKEYKIERNRPIIK